MINAISLIISLVALGFSFFVYIKQKKYDQEMLDLHYETNNNIIENKANRKTDKVVDECIRLHSSAKNKGIPALLSAGILTLNEGEATHAIGQISTAGYAPLSSNHNTNQEAQIKEIGIIKFLTEFQNRQRQDPTVRVDAVLSDLGREV